MSRRARYAWLLALTPDCAEDCDYFDSLAFAGANLKEIMSTMEEADKDIVVMQQEGRINLFQSGDVEGEEGLEALEGAEEHTEEHTEEEVPSELELGADIAEGSTEAAFVAPEPPAEMDEILPRLPKELHELLLIRPATATASPSATPSSSSSSATAQSSQTSEAKHEPGKQ